MNTSDDDLYKQDEPHEDSVVIAVKVPKALREAFKQHCLERNVDMSHVMRRFIERELQKAKK